MQRTIDAAGCPVDQVVGSIPERRRVVTVEKLAANAVMAGCLPNYFPVVLAAAEAMLDPLFNLVGPSSSLGGSGILVIVNGPVVKRLGINSRNNLFGPGNRANATIGRAIRLTLMNACGAIPGLFDRSILGHPGKYTYCIAEAENDTHWTPLHVERGFHADESAVTVFACEGPRQVRTAGGPENIITAVADHGFRARHFDVDDRIHRRHLHHRQTGRDRGRRRGDRAACGTDGLRQTSRRPSIRGSGARSPT